MDGERMSWVDGVGTMWDGERDDLMKEKDWYVCLSERWWMNYVGVDEIVCGFVCRCGVE